MEIKSRVLTLRNASILIAFTIFFAIRSKTMDEEHQKAQKPLKELVRYTKDVSSNILCYNSDDNDDLYSADYTSFPSSDNVIFFHETSCKGGLDSRQACSIESAARSNPDWEIYLLFTGPVDSYTLSSATFTTLLQYDNIHMRRIHPREYSKGTPLERMFAENFLDRSIYPVHHASDAIRFTTLYKHGGVHLDLDMIVVKSFNVLAKNFFARQDEEYADPQMYASPIGTAILRLSKDEIGKVISREILNEFANNFNPDYWDDNGPGLLRRVLRSVCATDSLYEMTPETCLGLELYPPQLFFPLVYYKSSLIFEYGDLNKFTKDSYAIHVWNKITQEYDTQNTVYERLAENYCPNIFRLYGEYFGL